MAASARPRQIITLVTWSLFVGTALTVALTWGLCLPSWPYVDQYAFTKPQPPSANVIEWWRRYAPEHFCERPAVVHLMHRVGYQSLAAYDQVDMSGTFFAYSKAYGWPAVCLELQHWVERYNSDHSRAFQATFWPWSPQTPQEFPIVPILPGMVINILFYATAFWAFRTVLSAMRRRHRLRHGLCPACAYPIGTRPVCTECGTQYPRLLRG